MKSDSAGRNRRSLARKVLFLCLLVSVIFNIMWLPSLLQNDNKNPSTMHGQWRKLWANLVDREVFPDAPRRNVSGAYKFCTSKGWIQKRWHCYQCDDTTSSCKRIRRHGHCPAIDRNMGNRPLTLPESSARVKEMFLYEGELPTQTMTFAKRSYHGHPKCTLLQPACWDLRRCSDPNNFTMYVNTTASHELVDYACNTIPHANRVSDHRQACLIVTFPDTYSLYEDFKSSDHMTGSNNLIYRFAHFKFRHRLTGDAPFQTFPIGASTIASDTLSSEVVRQGYDLVLPLTRKWGRETKSFDLHRPRRWLLSFRGDILLGHRSPFYQHRWLASEYWENADDIFVSTQCRRRTPYQMFRKYDDRVDGVAMDSDSVYSAVMWNSTFGFAPGGAGVSSFRLGEIMSTGGIPVVAGSDIVLPFSPDLDWTKCAVRVAEERIIDLPAILRKISADEVRSRQVECWRLLRLVWGDKPVRNAAKNTTEFVSDDRVTFAKAMEIFSARVAHAVEWKSRQAHFAKLPEIDNGA